MRIIISVWLLVLATFPAAGVAQTPTQEAPPPLPLKATSTEKARFRLIETQNMWTLLMLDTRTGRLWQVQVSAAKESVRTVIPVSTVVLADGEDGRFSLTMTRNMWNGVLVDTMNGRVWQCQFGMSAVYRFCEPIDVERKD